MRGMASQIEIYEEMRALSANMVEAARSGDWDNLVALEKSVLALRVLLPAEDDNPRLTNDERELKRTLIQGILDDDAEIRRHTEPWMDKLLHLFSAAGRSALRDPRRSRDPCA